MLQKVEVEIEETRRLVVGMAMHCRLGAGCGLGKLSDCLLMACMLE
jgi:hypothetical protein